MTGPAWDACDGLETEGVATAGGLNVILDTLAEPFQGEHETELFDALEDTFCGPRRKKGERLHDHALRVQSNVRELAKQRVRLRDEVQGFLLLRRANLSTQARIAIMTLAGNSLSFNDVRKACKRYAAEFLRDPKEHDTRGPHTVYVSQAQEASVTAEEQERDSDVETALAALARESDIDLEETDVQEVLLACKVSRQLRGEQRVNRCHRPVTGRTSGGKPYRVEGRLNIEVLISRTRCRVCREKGHLARECPNKGKQVPRKVGTGAHTKMGPEHATQKVQLEKAMTFRFGNDETLETRTLTILPVGIVRVNGVLRVHVVPGGAPLWLSKEFLGDLGCHIDLGRGHRFFQELGVRAVATSEQSPHLLLPLTSFGPQGHNILAEIQPRLSSEECAIYGAACDSSEQNKIHSWIASASDHRAPETDSNDEQPFRQDLTERRRTTVRFLGQQSDMTIDDTWPQAGEMRSLWKGTTEFGTDGMSQDDTWKPNRHHSNILPLFRNHLTRNAVAMFPLSPNPVASTEHGCRGTPICPLCHTTRMPRRKDDAWFWVCQNYPTCTASTTTTPPVPQNLKTLLKQSTTGSQRRDVDTSWSSP